MIRPAWWEAVAAVAWCALAAVAVIGWDRLVSVSGAGLDHVAAVAAVLIGLVTIPAVLFRRRRRPSAASGDGVVWRFGRNRLAVVGFAILVGILMVAVLAPILAPYSPDPGGAELAGQPSLAPPSPSHPMGTDLDRRDVLSRVVYGARISLGVGVSASLISMIVGTLLGTVAGYVGGGLDAVVMRFVDVVIAFPRIILLIAVAAVLDASVGVVILVIGLTQWPGTARLVRGDVLSLREREFVLAAEALGLPRRRIVLRYLLPNVLAPVLVATSLGVGNAIILEAGLSFLGVGLPAHVPSWGNLVSAGRDVLLGGWWLTLFPGVAIILVVLAFNLVGDGLRDALDPRDQGARPS